jgi:MOSC domain-containing protein YiiM
MNPGSFGENLTTAGIDLGGSLIGERWRVGTVVLEVSEPRFPCFKLGVKLGTQRFLRQFANARRPGAYLRIAEEGELGAGDELEVLERPDHGVTIGLFAEAYLGDRGLLPRLLAADQLSAKWRSWIEEAVAKAG